MRVVTDRERESEGERDRERDRLRERAVERVWSKCDIVSEIQG